MTMKPNLFSKHVFFCCLLLDSHPTIYRANRGVQLRPYAKLGTSTLSIHFADVGARNMGPKISLEVWSLA